MRTLGAVHTSAAASTPALLARLLQLYLEGCSYRAVRRILERACGSSLGLMSIWQSFMATGKGPHVPPPRPPAQYLGLDEMHLKVRGQPRWLLSVSRPGCQWGQTLGGLGFANDRTQDAWETALVALGISRHNPPFAVISDGDVAIEGAIAQALP